MRFVDTNILLYAVSNVPEESSKSRVALDLLESDDLCLSIQVLQEFYVQATQPPGSDRLISSSTPVWATGTAPLSTNTWLPYEWSP
jgi:predicted nucleic acid-binding protein